MQRLIVHVKGSGKNTDVVCLGRERSRPRQDLSFSIILCLNKPLFQHFGARINEIDKFRFQKGDRVQWTESDDDIPEGHIGVVMGIKYEEDDNGKTSGKRVYVNWPNGRWSMKTHTLESLNFDTDGVNQLKLSFKRFDTNGDGKLSEEELVNVLGKIGGEGGAGLAPEECKQLFEALDKDGNGKLTVSEFIDYVFSDASGAAKVLLADGFGLDSALGFGEEEEERDYESDDDDPMSSMKGQPFDGPLQMKSSFSPDAAEGVDGETEVSRAEWATAMLQVGIPRKAALTCFEEVSKDLAGSCLNSFAVKCARMKIEVCLSPILGTQ